MTSGVAQISAEAAWNTEGSLPVYGAPEGADAMVIAEAAYNSGHLVGHIARDGARAAAMVQALRFFAPDLAVIEYPAWDCLPYDRVSPSGGVSSRRMAALAAILTMRNTGPLIVVTSINAAIQRTPPADVIENAAMTLSPGASMDMDALTRYLTVNGYARSSTVREAGEFAVRGGLVDIYPPGAEEPVRLDFFGDSLESIRAFDAASQRTTRQLTRFDLSAASEILLNDETVKRFRTGYVKTFGTPGDDPLYEAISAGRMHAGAEHWLPLFYVGTDTLFDFIGESLLFVDHQADEAAEARFETISDYYGARVEDMNDGKNRGKDFSAPAYRPLPPERLYLDNDEWHARLAAATLRPLSPFSPPENTRCYHFGAKVGRNFAAERAVEKGNVFDAVLDHVDNLKQAGKKSVIACWSEGSADRMRTVLSDHGASQIVHAENGNKLNAASGLLQTAVLGLENGFETADTAFVSEQDILGDRLVRRSRRKRAENFLSEASSLTLGDLVVHVEHGIARYEGLKTLEVQGAPHDCLHLAYHGGDKLFLPVENIDLLSRFGSDSETQALDKLGGAAWQGRKAKMRARIKMLAEQLIAIAAKRAMQSADEIAPSSGAYEEFCARFPFAETDDQENAIADVIEDLARGRPMDRLVCGDVGFGKTEVALRAAFVTAMTGRQVAVIAPTTLLVRQHFKNFSERFKGFPVKVGQLSRMVPSSEANAVREGIANGQCDIVIGTHALLAKTIKFNDLGLMIVDEEQHFGVKHKERLKEFRGDTHVLTLTATPIPRTLQLAMSGIRDLSLIATPPVDRLAVRTTVGPFDPVVARETLLARTLPRRAKFLRGAADQGSRRRNRRVFCAMNLPELKFKIAHGQMGAGELEDIMTAFYEGKFDVLVSTTIIESGLDIPTANTMLIHHADMFGLSRSFTSCGDGWGGRSKRAFAYLTTSPRKRLTEGAERRLKVMQSLDTLGAGFTLASPTTSISAAPGNLAGRGTVRQCQGGWR